MYDTIVVPLDGSRLAERALPLAAAVASGTGARLVLVQVVAPDGARAHDGDSRPAPAASAYLAGVASRLALQGVCADGTTRSGDVVSGILEAIEAEGGGIVIMGTHGRSGLGRWLYGSVAAGVLAGARVPVLLTRAVGTAERLPIDWRGRPVLVALDGSAAAERVLPHAVVVAGALGAGVILQRVVRVAEALASELGGFLPIDETARVAMEDDDARADLGRLAARLAARGLRVDVRVQRATSPAEAILAEASRVGAGLVALGSHGRTGLSRVLFGSVAHEVLHQGGLPLLILRTSAMR